MKTAIRSRRLAQGQPYKAAPGASAPNCLFVPTSAHLVLWVERNRPKWAQGLKLNTLADVDSILNARAGTKWPTSLHNSLSLLELVRSNQKNARKGETISGYFAAYRPDNATPNRSRDNHFKRWAKGLRKGEARRMTT